MLKKGSERLLLSGVVHIDRISFLFFFRKDLPKNAPRWANYTAGISLFLSLGLAVYAIQNLPFIDFRAYKIGVNIPVNMQPSAPMVYTYVMKKGGELVYLDQYPTDESYEFVEMTLNNPEALPKISDFAAWNGEGDQSELLFQGNKVILLSSNLTKMSDANLDLLSQLFASLEKAPVEIIFMAAATQEEIDAVIAKNGWKIKGLQADATVVKTIMRANPGIMLLKDGVVVGKYHHNNTPEALEVLDLF